MVKRLCKSSGDTCRISHLTPVPRSHGQRGFTIVELLVVLGIVIILLSIFIPYLVSKREESHRISCANHLRQIRDALQAYAMDNDQNLPGVRYDSSVSGYAAFSGPDENDPFAPQSSVEPNDVTASLWLLVRRGLIRDTRAFVCPSTNDYRDRLTDSSGRITDVQSRSNFRHPSNLSYSYASPFSSAPNYRLNFRWLNAEFVLMADKNPGISGINDDVTLPPYNADALALAKGNSNNHGKAGQNVLYGDGHVDLMRSPYCGISYNMPGRDNIYTARAAIATTQPTTAPHYINGFCGRDLSPAGPDDSYLVPTDDDVAPPNSAARSTSPATAPSTAATSATLPTTTGAS